ncbi:hypothetical protein M440DRAFT_1127739 [Trichoderma longibrachiatum ATCC 18648]|uniref:Uncharacterized protein n=1 Tax=Trichoderma longibrachiatum ATCC 18648 TaxID=983965 RepID=A0A2T4CG07_TRILO|nr:hypothetical protein M440DRAFT_1127739 [Trichoderma longibrachiatum ATCC 18648]
MMRPLGDIFSASGRKPYLRGFILCDGRPDSDILPLELWLAGCQRDRSHHSEELHCISLLLATGSDHITSPDSTVSGSHRDAA